MKKLINKLGKYQNNKYKIKLPANKIYRSNGYESMKNIKQSLKLESQKKKSNEIKLILTYLQQNNGSLFHLRFLHPGSLR